ncbi:hypothetical protein [Nostoc sp. DedQUE07]|uniref:hypothetical protein n=1 Tax=Nostoc sp. DedQUE07 TaxID=3075392 RepID=UPI002AD39E23|nr:hypothetical protein [Nostoc sp. DedQUE07]MDZ8131974.1 hypothetical protein [Nostoc sp. DedQUE07]
MFNPQSINPLNLPLLPLEQRSLLPQTPCIYFVIDCQDSETFVVEFDRSSL